MKHCHKSIISLLLIINIIFLVLLTGYRNNLCDLNTSQTRDQIFIAHIQEISRDIRIHTKNSKKYALNSTDLNICKELLLDEIINYKN